MKSKVELITQDMDKYKNDVETMSNELSKYKEALKEETILRRKAEDMVTALKPLLDINKQEQVMMEVSMKTKNILQKENKFTCYKCQNIYESESSLKDHTNKCHKADDKKKFECTECTNMFYTKNALDEHVRQSHDKNTFDCTKCKNVYTIKADLEEHIRQSHGREKCQQCNKEYSNNFELKRHIWRSHEIVDCMFCEKKLENRHNLKRHKNIEHMMTRVPNCKFYDEGKCVDGDECLFEHNTTSAASIERKQDANTSPKQTKFCKKGLKCERINCDINENGHKRIKEVPCKFQKRCKKPMCPFKHDASLLDFWEIRNDKRSK
jgi:hypothetical protein